MGKEKRGMHSQDIKSFLTFKIAVNEISNIGLNTYSFGLAIFPSNSSGNDVTGEWIIPLHHRPGHLLQLKPRKSLNTSA